MGNNTSRWLLGCALAIAACGGTARNTCVAGPESSREVSLFEPSGDLKKAVSSVHFRSAKGSDNLSDAALTAQGQMVLVSDEGTELAIVDPARAAAQVYDLSTTLAGLPTPLGATAPDEIDLEGVATWNEEIVLCGSASLKRQKAKAGKDNIARIAQVTPASGEGNAHSNYVMIVERASDASAPLRLIDHWDLRALLLADPLLQPFRELPSKDNGIDVEGVAADAEHLYFGLRGPVLRGHAVVVRTDWKGGQPELRFLDLHGLGIRSLLREPEGKGFYVLAGPTMDLDGPFAVYAWDGQTSVFEGDGTRALARVTDVPSDAASHPEALFIWNGALCTLADGPADGAPACATKQSVRWPL